MIATVVNALTNIGIRVKTIVSDGLKSNFAAYEILGATFTDDDTTPYIFNQANGDKIYVIHDPPHMIKLIRGCLSDEKVLCDNEKRLIEWKYIERLYRCKTGGIRSHKLSKRHIDWKSAPMKVSLATQTISMSVAQSIEKLAESGLDQFTYSEGTIEFIKRFNNLFDVFNADKDIEGNIYKTPINKDTKNTIFNFLDNMIGYINGLTLNGKKITQSTRNTGFKGFRSNIIALKMIYEELVETNLIDKIRTTAIQQDLLESFFGRMRSGNGYNTNPTQQQFCANFTRTLMNKELTSSTLSNCIDKLEILTVSSGAAKETSNHEEKNYIMISENADVHEAEILDEFDDTTIGLEIAEEMGISSTAGVIQANIERNHRFNCNDCAKIFEDNEKIDSAVFVKYKKNVLPCKSTYDLCKLNNGEMSTYLKTVHVSRFKYDELFNKIKSKLINDNLFPM